MSGLMLKLEMAMTSLFGAARGTSSGSISFETWQGKVPSGEAWPGMARQGNTVAGSGTVTYGGVRPGKVWQGTVRLGKGA